MKLVPVSLKEANEFVARYHRHHSPVVGHKFSIGCEEDGELSGVAIVGRPVSRYLDDGRTLEVTRLCSTGKRNVCSFLYSACARAAKALGYRKIITYILESETGTSLKASGWISEGRAGKPAWTGERNVSARSYLFPELEASRLPPPNTKSDTQKYWRKKMLPKYITELMDMFPGSFINHIDELILVPKTNLYISLSRIHKKEDLRWKLLESCSRDACKTQCFGTNRKDDEYHAQIAGKINSYLGTNFSKEDFDLIYTFLGNGCNHKRTLAFINSGYDMELLRALREKSDRKAAAPRKKTKAEEMMEFF